MSKPASPSDLPSDLPSDHAERTYEVRLFAELSRLLVAAPSFEVAALRLAELVLAELARAARAPLLFGVLRLQGGALAGELYSLPSSALSELRRRAHALVLAPALVEELFAADALVRFEHAGALPEAPYALAAPLRCQGEAWGVVLLASALPLGASAALLLRGAADGLTLVLERQLRSASLRALEDKLEHLALAARAWEVAAQDQLRAYHALADFGTIIGDCDDVDRLTDLGVGSLQAQLGTEFAARFDVLAGRLRLVKVWGMAPAGLRRLLGRRPPRLGEGVVGEAALAAEVVYSPSYAQDPRALAGPLRFGCEMLLAVPVRQRGRAVSVLAFCAWRKLGLSDDQLTIARTFARRLESALERRDNLYEVEATREGTLRALGLALEYRDLETKGHTDRVVDLSMRFGARLGLGADKLQSLRWGAYLHDIGKLAIPDSVLLKPGRLSPDEFEVIKRHCTIGHATCCDIPFLPEDTRALVRSHHECWAGGGYPDGLRAQDISLLARMFSLVDVYDALCSERPYKRAWPRERALDEIRALAERQFDPELVPVFLEVAENEA